MNVPSLQEITPLYNMSSTNWKIIQVFGINEDINKEDYLLFLVSGVVGISENAKQF